MVEQGKSSYLPILIVIFALITVGYFFMNNDTIQYPSSEEESASNSEEDAFSTSIHLHWTHMPITYSIQDYANCGDLQIKKMLEALEILENKTGYIKFVKTNNSDPDLKIQCLDLKEIRNSYFKEIERLKNSSALNCKREIYSYKKDSISTYTEGILNKSEHLFINASKQYLSPTTIWTICYINTSDINYSNIKTYGLDTDWRDISGDTLGEARPITKGDTITKATINLYTPEEGWSVCTDFPVKEMHELLHIFGFGHSYEPYWDPYNGYSETQYLKDMMFPYVYCLHQKEVQYKYISCLNYIYSNEKQGSCGRDVSFLEREFGCTDGGYEVEGTGYCCPEPNMIIDEEGYCAEE